MLRPALAITIALAAAFAGGCGLVRPVTEMRLAGAIAPEMPPIASAALALSLAGLLPLPSAALLGAPQAIARATGPGE